MPILKKPSNATQQPKGGNTFGKKPTPKDETPDDVPMDHHAKKGAGGTDSWGKRFEETDGKGGYTAPPPGTYNGLITEAQASRESEGVGEVVFFEVTITDEELAGKPTRIYYNFTDKDGNESTGMPFFKMALEMLGAEQPKSWSALEALCAEIAQQQPWVIIDCKKRGPKVYTNLNSVPEDQDSKPALP